MKRNKSFLALCLTILSTGLVLSACGGKNDSSTTEPTSNNPTSDLTTETSEDPSTDTSTELSTDTTDTSDTTSSGDSGLDELPEKLTILYQGDSITDASSTWDDANDLGNGYARMISEQLDGLYGDDIDFTFYNYAHSGWNLIDNWYEGGVNHYQDQFYKFNADIVTILIGYNDIQDAYYDGGYTSSKYVSDEAYEAAYDELLAGLKERGSYAICIGPYFIYDRADIEYCQTEFANKRAIVQALAEKYDFTYVDMKPAMEAAVQAGAAEMELFGDLTHPSYAGNIIIADLVQNEIRDYFDPDYERNENAGAYVPITGHNDNANDYTNKKVYCYSSLGPVEYDQTVCNNRDDFASSESLKIVNDGNEHAGAYTQASVVLGNAGMDLINKQIEFDMKAENAVPWASLLAHSSVWTKSRDKSSETGFDFSNGQRVEPIGNGWYHVTLKVNDWVLESEGNDTILKNCRQLVFCMSRGEDNAARTRFGIDLSRPSILWIDNLAILESGGGTTVETATKTNNWELMSLDTGWQWGTAASFTTTETYGISTKARKFTFADSSCDKNGSPLADDGNSQVYVCFSPEHEWGSDTGIDVKNVILSFDVKFSQEFFDSEAVYKHMMSIQFIDKGWVHQTKAFWYDWVLQGKYGFTMERSDNGWLHFERDLSEIDDTTFKSLDGNLIRLRIGIFGLTETSKKTASLVFDNMKISQKAN